MCSLGCCKLHLCCISFVCSSINALTFNEGVMSEWLNSYSLYRSPSSWLLFTLYHIFSPNKPVRTPAQWPGRNVPSWFSLALYWPDIPSCSGRESLHEALLWIGYDLCITPARCYISGRKLAEDVIYFPEGALVKITYDGSGPVSRSFQYKSWLFMACYLFDRIKRVLKAVSTQNNTTRSFSKWTSPFTRSQSNKEPLISIACFMIDASNKMISFHMYRRECKNLQT